MGSMLAMLPCQRESNAPPQMGLEEAGVKRMGMPETWGCRMLVAVMLTGEVGMQAGPAGDVAVVGAVGVAEEVGVGVVVEGVGVGEVDVGEGVAEGVGGVEVRHKNAAGVPLLPPLPPNPTSDHLISWCLTCTNILTSTNCHLDQLSKQNPSL